MNRDQFNELVKNPQNIDGNSSAWLKEFMQKFPYCSTLHAMYAKSLNQKNDVNYTKQLRIAASYVGNREKLFNLIQLQPPAVIKEEIKTASLAIKPPSVEEKETKFTEKNTETTTALLSSVTNSVPSKPAYESTLTNPETASVEPKEKKTEFPEPPSSEKEIEIKQEIQTNQKKKDSEEQEKSISAENLKEVKKKEPQLTDSSEEKPLESRVKGSLSKEKNLKKLADKIQTPSGEDEDSAEIDLELEQLNKEILTQAISSSILLEASQIDDDTDNPEEYSDDDSEEYPEEEVVKKNFLDWLNYEAPPAKQAKPQDKTVKEKAKPTEKQKDNQTLIDKFIRNNPEIVPKKTEFFSATTHAKKSLVDNKAIVSETLAKIYINQTKYNKAIEVYQLLGLKYPEKSTYFELQIRLTEELMNKNK